MCWSKYNGSLCNKNICAWVDICVTNTQYSLDISLLNQQNDYKINNTWQWTSSFCVLYGESNKKYMTRLTSGHLNHLVKQGSECFCKEVWEQNGNIFRDVKAMTWIDFQCKINIFRCLIKETVYICVQVWSIYSCNTVCNTLLLWI